MRSKTTQTVTLRYPQDIVLVDHNYETAFGENFSTTRRFMPAGSQFKIVARRVGHHEPQTIVEFEDQLWSIG